MSETLQLDPAKTALVLIEYQNEFTSEGGVLHGAVSGGDGQDRHAGRRRSPWSRPPGRPA